MKTRALFKGLALTVVLATASTPAAAVDLTVRFTGRFLASTCAFTVADVDLGSYSATTFTGSTTTPLQNIVVRASSCTPDITTVHMAFFGTADTTVTSYFAARSVTGNVTGVGIELMNGSSQRVTPNVTRFDWPFATWGMNYNLFARFAQTRPSVTAGTVSTPITIQFTYN